MSFGRIFLILLIGLPFVEIYLLVRLVGTIGFMATLGIVLLAAVAGLSLMQRRGASSLIRVQQAMARGELPAQEVVDSGLVALAGALLILPGVVSDLVALICILPATRLWMTEYLLSKTVISQPTAKPTSGPVTLEGEFHREE